MCLSVFCVSRLFNEGLVHISLPTELHLYPFFLVFFPSLCPFLLFSFLHFHCTVTRTQVLCIQGKHSLPEPHPSPCLLFLSMQSKKDLVFSQPCCNRNPEFYEVTCKLKPHTSFGLLFCLSAFRDADEPHIPQFTFTYFLSGSQKGTQG